MSHEEEINLENSKNLFTDQQVKSSRRYLHEAENDPENEDFDNIKALTNREEPVALQDNMKMDHTAEIEADCMPKNHASNTKGVIETEMSEFRKLP